MEDDYPQWFAEAETRRLVEIGSGALASVMPEHTKDLSELAQQMGGVQTGASRGQVKEAVVEKILDAAVDGAGLSLGVADRQTLANVIGALPADRLLYYGGQLTHVVKTGDTRAYLESMVETYRSLATSGELEAYSVQEHELVALERALARARVSVEPDAGGYGSRQRQDFNRLLESVGE